MPYGDVRRRAERGGGDLLGFGEYHDWAYGEIMTHRPNYVTYICSESGDESEAQKQFKGCVRLKELGIEKEAPAESSRSK